MSKTTTTNNYARKYRILLNKKIELFYCRVYNIILAYKSLEAALLWYIIGRGTVYSGILLPIYFTNILDQVSLGPWIDLYLLTS